jgi:hypothetical protein
MGFLAEVWARLAEASVAHDEERGVRVDPKVRVTGLLQYFIP